MTQKTLGEKRAATIGLLVAALSWAAGCTDLPQAQKRETVRYPYVESEIDLSQLPGLQGCRAHRVITGPSRWLTVTRCAGAQTAGTITDAPIARRGTDPRQEPTGSRQ